MNRSDVKVGAVVSRGFVRRKRLPPASRFDRLVTRIIRSAGGKERVIYRRRNLDGLFAGVPIGCAMREFCATGQTVVEWRTPAFLRRLAAADRTRDGAARRQAAASYC